MDPNQPTQTPPENIVLQDTGHMTNLLQGGVSAKTLSLTLYNTHLRIDDANTGETIEDVPLSQIEKTSRIYRSRLVYSLFAGGVLSIKTAQKDYKISWGNLDAERVLMGPAGGGSMNAWKNYQKNMTWIRTIKNLQAGVSVPQTNTTAQNIQQPTPSGYTSYTAQSTSGSGKGLGYFLIFGPIVVLLTGSILVGISIKFSIHSKDLVGAAAGLIIVGFLCLPWGLIFGLRKIRNS